MERAYKVFYAAKMQKQKKVSSAEPVQLLAYPGKSKVLSYLAASALRRSAAPLCAARNFKVTELSGQFKYYEVKGRMDP